MTLFEICRQLAIIENGLAFGQIDFSYDNLMCAMKPGHPADIMDDIFCDIGNTLYLNNDAKIDPEALKKMYDELVLFQKSFKVQELAEPLRELKKYIGK